jgi:cell division initiation protein
MFDPALSKRRGEADTSGQGRPVLDPRERGAHGSSEREGSSGLQLGRVGVGPHARDQNGPRGFTMNVSPLDLRQQKFRSRLRGFDKVEVASFLTAVADDYEAALRETDRLRQDLMRVEALLNEHREHERNLKNTLMTAQKLAEDIKVNAQEEARRIIREAEGRSDFLLEKTQSRLEDIQREIDGLKLKRRDVETSIEATIGTLRNTLEYVHEQEARERDDKILLHRPRYSEPAESRDPHETRKIVG